MNKNTEILNLINDAKKKEYKCKITKFYKVAIAGITGIVGKELLSILKERKFPIAKLVLLASKNSVGEKFNFNNKKISVKALKKDSFNDVEIAFFALNSELAKKYCLIAAKKGVICIDKSSAFRNDIKIPLVVPEVNKETIKNFNIKNIIATPNCICTPLVQVLKPLNNLSSIKRVILSSYQAVSGIGKTGIHELDKQVRELLNFRNVNSSVFKNKIAFNLLPIIPTQNGVNACGTSKEEQKIIDETRKILNLDDLLISASCVRVPVYNTHSANIHIEFKNNISIENIKQTLHKSPGLSIIDDAINGIFPTPNNANGQDVTLVGRIRRDLSCKHGIILWLSSDNLRTGSALNAVKIAEILCEKYLN